MPKTQPWSTFEEKDRVWLLKYAQHHREMLIKEKKFENFYELRGKDNRIKMLKVWKKEGMTGRDTLKECGRKCQKSHLV